LKDELGSSGACDTGTFGDLSVASHKGWVQGYIKISETEPVQITGYIGSDGKGELVSSWPLANPIKVQITINSQTDITAHILGSNDQSCGQKLELSGISRSLFDEETLVERLGGALRTNEQIQQEYERLGG